jgi:hypothetical protein
MKLQAIQDLLAEIYDVQLEYDVTDFVLTDREHVPNALRSSGTDEQLLVAQDAGTLWIGLYLDPAVLERLSSADPLAALHAGNIADYWTVLEGVSHFVYVTWNAAHDRPVTILELELQSEIDKYVSSLWLLREQHPERFPVELHHVLFERTRVDALLAGDQIGLYRHANSYAARFCQRLAHTLRSTGYSAREGVLAELRQFYRLSRQRKFRHIENMA